MTKYKRKLSSGLLVANCDPEVETQVRFLFDYLQGLESALFDGYKMQFGWTVFKIERSGDEWIVMEPNFDGDPYSTFRSDITTSLRVQAQMNDMIHSNGGMTDGIPLFYEHIIHRKGVLTEQNLVVNRDPPSAAGDSGWYIGSVREDLSEEKEDDADVYASIQVWHLLKLRPGILQVLALPIGTMALFHNDDIVRVYRE